MAILYIELEWDDRAVAHIARHSVKVTEVEDVVYGSGSLVVRISRGRYMVYGQTISGRYVKVVLETTGRGYFYPVTAYEMDGTDRRMYRRKTRG